MEHKIQLTPRIEQIVSFYFEHPSMSYTDLGKQFAVSVQRISQIMAHPRVLASYPMLAKRRIKSLVPKAVKRLEQLMDQPVNLNVSEKIVSRILDTEKVLEPIEHRVVHQLEFLSIPELQKIVDKASSLPQAALDAEIVEDETNDNK